jgi:hypothetical protein
VKEAETYLDGVFQRYQRAGLKSLKLQPKGDSAGQDYDVIATASPGDDVGNVTIKSGVIAPKEGEIRTGGLDSRGRATKAFGWLSNTNAGRDPAAQSQRSERLNALLRLHGIDTQFDAGHLIAARYGGPGGEENLVPQVRGSNRSWWKSYENVVAKEVSANAPGELIYAEAQAGYGGNPWDRIVNPDDLVALSPAARDELENALAAVPDSIAMARLGRRKVDGSEVPLPTPGPFDARAELPSLGRSLRAIVGTRIRRTGEVFER